MINNFATMNTTFFKTIITGRQAIAKIFIFAIVIASVATILVSCSARKNAPPPEAMTDEGVVINGVRWATRNADGFRTFVSSPEAMGGFYEWRTDRARDRHSLRRTRARRADGQSDRWSPCPPGWRLPTPGEFESLIAAGSVWVEKNGVYGRLFGTAPHQLFLPAAGQFREDFSLVPENNENEWGFYWICPESEPPQSVPLLAPGLPRMLRFNQEIIFMNAASGTSFARGIDMSITRPPEGLWRAPIRVLPEFSVRCVAVTADD